MKGRKMTIRERQQLMRTSAIERRKVFRELCEHVAKGYSVECFPELQAKMLGDYQKLYPEEFVQEELDVAKQRGQRMWEGLGHAQASGNCLGNSRTWYYNMSNRYGWRDRVDVKAEHSGGVQFSVVSYAADRQLSEDIPEQIQ
jgi:hypothetical protein